MKTAISAVIKENNNHEITGQVLQTTLLAMVDSLAGGYLFKGVATPSTVVGTPDENVFYIGGAGTYSNFGATPVNVPDCCIGIFTYNGSFENHIIPTGGVFDISAYNAVGGTPATYANLTAALGTDGANIPDYLRKGGMSVKFIQGSAPSSDNNYVQFRCMPDEFTTDISAWQGVDAEPTAGSKNLVESGGVVDWAEDIYGRYTENREYIAVWCDKDGKIAIAIRKKDGSIYYGAGVPPQLKEYIEGLLNGKVDKEDGMSLIDSVFASMQSSIDSPEFMRIELSSIEQILGGRRKDGTVVENMPVETPSAIFSSMADIEHRLAIVFDSDGHIISYRKKNGVLVENVGIDVPVIVSNSLNLTESGMEQFIQDLEEHGFSPTAFDYFPDNEYKPMMASMKRREISGTPATGGYGVQRTDYQTLVLASITDTHNNNTMVKNFLDFCSRHESNIDGLIHIGDLVNNEFVNPYNHPSVQGWGNIMVCIGNHDAYAENHSGFSDVVSAADCYDRYLKDNIASWGVQYTPDLCYYYKDFSYYVTDGGQQVLKGIRYIVLDCMHWDATQKTWLENILYNDNENSALAKGLQVVIAQHVPASGAEVTSQTFVSGMNFFECTFNPKDELNSVYHTYNYDSLAVVDAFQQAGGTFICWLYGHWHVDGVGKYIEYPNQIFIVQAVGGFTGAGGYSDTERVAGTESENQFSVYSFDIVKNYIRILRVGAEYDRNLQHKKTLTLSYKNTPSVISNY